ncbi:MAG: hypothetical protein EOO28_06825 [Comamonadaceae bacterium]|nr:MAG: hypothetical protein EOO28_06825 [Comamonadaceae bacterium]
MSTLKNLFSWTLAWLAAAGLAFALAFAAPNEASVMGRMPSFMAQTLSRQNMVIPDGLSAERTLALINFRKGQRQDIQGWIDGMGLKDSAQITWLRMPVLNDPGTSNGRVEVEDKLLAHYLAPAERARLLPVFTDADSFRRAAGLTNSDQVYAVVINRHGDILARVEGQYDPDKADALRETLLHGSSF